MKSSFFASGDWEISPFCKIILTFAGHKRIAVLLTEGMESAAPLALLSYKGNLFFTWDILSGLLRYCISWNYNSEKLQVIVILCIWLEWLLSQSASDSSLYKLQKCSVTSYVCVYHLDLEGLVSLASFIPSGCYTLSTFSVEVI